VRTSRPDHLLDLAQALAFAATILRPAAAPPGAALVGGGVWPALVAVILVLFPPALAAPRRNNSLARKLVTCMLSFIIYMVLSFLFGNEAIFKKFSASSVLAAMSASEVRDAWLASDAAARGVAPVFAPVPNWHIFETILVHVATHGAGLVAVAELVRDALQIHTDGAVWFAVACVAISLLSAFVVYSEGHNGNVHAISGARYLLNVLGAAAAPPPPGGGGGGAPPPPPPPPGPGGGGAPPADGGGAPPAGGDGALPVGGGGGGGGGAPPPPPVRGPPLPPPAGGAPPPPVGGGGGAGGPPPLPRRRGSRWGDRGG
jgi:hypothetical protein